VGASSIDDRHVETRDALHRIVNHVLARAEYAAAGRFGLRVTPGGFGTISFGPGPERIRVAGGLLVRESGSKAGTWTRTMEIDGASLGELARFADVDVSVDFSAGNDTPPVGDVDAPISLHEPAAVRIGAWFGTVAQALDRVVGAAPPDAAPSLAQLWPEHFDLALDLAFDPTSPSDRRVNLGGSPGDSGHPAPYLYVGPWTPDRPGDAAFWNASFGATVAHDRIDSADDAVDFFRRGTSFLAP
jgi:hypothetical protein